MITRFKYKYLIDMAKMAREHAYTPYSDFKVGASIRTSENKIFTGVNIEFSTYGLSICAERAALIKTVSEGFTDIEELAVVADSETPFVPCGACLQMMFEFNKNIKIAMANLTGDTKVVKITRLLTSSFKIKFDKRK